MSKERFTLLLYIISWGPLAAHLTEHLHTCAHVIAPVVLEGLLCLLGHLSQVHLSHDTATTKCQRQGAVPELVLQQVRRNMPLASASKHVICKNLALL